MWFVGDYNNRSHAVNMMLSTVYVYMGADTYDYQSVHKKGMTKRWMVNSQCSSQKQKTLQVAAENARISSGLVRKQSV
jgi:hypothetical protein